MIAIIRTPAGSSPVSCSIVATASTTSDHARARATRRSATWVTPNPARSTTRSSVRASRAAPGELGRYALTDDPRVDKRDDEIHEREIREERDEQPFADDVDEPCRGLAAVVVEELDEDARDPVDGDERADQDGERTPIEEEPRRERRDKTERQVEAQDVPRVGPEDLTRQWSEKSELLAPAQDARYEDRAGRDEHDLADPREANEQLEAHGRAQRYPKDNASPTTNSPSPAYAGARCSRSRYPMV